MNVLFRSESSVKRNLEVLDNEDDVEVSVVVYQCDGLCRCFMRILWMP